MEPLDYLSAEPEVEIVNHLKLHPLGSFDAIMQINGGSKTHIRPPAGSSYPAEMFAPSSGGGKT
jgi:hypothetical protein